MAKNRTELFKKLQPHYLTEPIIQSVIIKIDKAKAGKHEGTTYFVDEAKTAPKVEVLFVNRFLGEPVITQGVSTVGFKLKSGGPATVNVQSNGQAPKGLSVGTIVHTAGGDYKITKINTDGSYVSVPYTGASATYSDYKGDWKMTIAGMLTKNDVIIGATIYINPRDVMTDGFDAGSYPLNGALRLLVSGFAATEDLGAIDEWDEVPSEWSTTKDSTEYDTDAPLAPTGCILKTGTTSPAGTDAKASALVAWVELDWEPVAHNDLTGYNVDIFEDRDRTKTPESITDTDFVGIPAQMFIDKSHNNCSWKGLTLSSRYWVRIQSVDAHSNHSDWLLVGYINTGKSEGVSKLDTITAELFRPNIIKVLWSYAQGTPNTDNASSYQLERKEAQCLDSSENPITLVWGSYVRIAETPGGFFIDTGLNRKKKYLYRVRAVCRYDDTYSAWLEMTTPVQPEGILDMDVQATALYNRLTAGGVLSGNLAAGCVTADKLYAGTITTYLGNFVNRIRGCTVKFSESSLNHVGWTAGTITLAKATYSAPSGKDPSTKDVTWGTSIFNMAGGSFSTTLSNGNTYYAYVTYAVDAVFSEPSGIGTVQVASTYPTGQYDIVLAVIRCTAAGHIEVEPVNATGTIINGDHIITGSIEAVKLNVTDLSAISANIGNITAGFIGGLSGSYFDVTNGILRIKAGRVSLDAGAISTSQLTNDALWTTDATANAARIAATNALNVANTKIAATDVQNAIRDNVTIIDGAKITTGSIAAGKIQLFGINTSQLNNNAGWTTDAAANAAALSAYNAQVAANAASTKAYSAAAQAGTAQYTADQAAQSAVNAANAAYNAQVSANSKVLPQDVAAAINGNYTQINGSKIVSGSIAAGSIAAGTLMGMTIYGGVIIGASSINTAGFLSAASVIAATFQGSSGYLNVPQSIHLPTGYGLYWSDGKSLWEASGHLYFGSTLLA